MGGEYTYTTNDVNVALHKSPVGDVLTSDVQFIFCSTVESMDEQESFLFL